VNHNGNTVIDVSETDFESAVIERSRRTPVVVDFWAAWCGPCRSLGPILERLAGEPNSGFLLAKVDVDANQRLAMQYQVRSIPAVKGFFNGKVVAEFVGAQPEPRIRQFLKQLIPNEIDRHLSAARELLVEEKWPAAEGAFRLVLQRKPDEQSAIMGLSQALLRQGKGCEAAQLLTEVSALHLSDQAERLLTLARYLCDSERLERENGSLDLPPLDAQYTHCAQLLRGGNLPAAFDGLIGIVRQDRQFRNGAAKQVLLAMFTLLGDQHELTRRYRSELAMVLF
jgi:putative thioredoxin